ncbi:hypothetical protein ACGYK6_17725 [Sulfitobacter sp. 1A15333]
MMEIKKVGIATIEALLLDSPEHDFATCQKGAESAKKSALR